MPGLSTSALSGSSGAALALRLRAGIACSLGRPIEAVQLNSTSDPLTGAVTYLTENDGGNLGGGSCDAFLAHVGGRRALQARSSHVPRGGVGRNSSLSRFRSKHVGPPLRRMHVVSSLSELGPGKAVWFHEMRAGGKRWQGRPRRLTAEDALTSIKIIIPPVVAVGGSLLSVTAEQQDEAEDLVDSLDSALAMENDGDSNGLLDSLSQTGFLESYSSATGVNPVDMAKSLNVGAAVVDVPSVTGTSTRSSSKTASQTSTASLTSTATLTPTLTPTQSSTASRTGTQTSSLTLTPSRSSTASSTQTGTPSLSATALPLQNATLAVSIMLPGGTLANATAPYTVSRVVAALAATLNVSTSAVLLLGMTGIAEDGSDYSVLLPPVSAGRMLRAAGTAARLLGDGAVVRVPREGPLARWYYSCRVALASPAEVPLATQLLWNSMAESALDAPSSSWQQLWRSWANATGQNVQDVVVAIRSSNDWLGITAPPPPQAVSPKIEPARRALSDGAIVGVAAAVLVVVCVVLCFLFLRQKDKQNGKAASGVPTTPAKPAAV